MKPKANNKQKSFEGALKRLEQIVSEMERGQLSLDAMLKKFDEGMRLAQFCSRKLEEAERKIEILIKKDDGTFETREFLPSTEAALHGESSEEDSSRGAETADEESSEDGQPLF